MRQFASLSCAFLLASIVVGAQAPVVSDALALQIMLDRVGFSPGEIDGQIGINARGALSAFQNANGLPATGQPNQATRQKLSEAAGDQPPLTTYTTTDADFAGPFSPEIPADLMEQSKLPALAYRNPLEGIAEKFHISPAVLRQLNPKATFDRAGDGLRVPNVTVVQIPDPSSRSGRAGARARQRGRASTAVGTAGTEGGFTIYVTKETSALTVEDGAEHLVFHAPVTTGSEHDPLPIGTWKVTTVQRMPAFQYNPELFWDANPSHAKARIPPGPNNPVGTIWVDLSKEHYGIHGTPEPSTVGHRQSHGCVRLTNWDAERLAQWAKPGVTVIFR